MNTALSLKNNRKLPEMERPLTQETSVTPINITFTLLEINLIEYKSMVCIIKNSFLSVPIY